MKFGTAQRIGLAGEYAMGAAVVSRLKWIYRIQQLADLGIDGEIEIVENEESTGRLLKVQVKTSETATRATVTVSPEHFNYWQLLGLPVIVCFVDLTSMDAVWWPSAAGKLGVTQYHYTPASARSLDARNAAAMSELAKKTSSTSMLDGLVDFFRAEAAVLVNRHPEEFGAVEEKRGEELRQLATAVKTLVRHLVGRGVGASAGTATELQRIEEEIDRALAEVRRFEVGVRRNFDS